MLDLKRRKILDLKTKEKDINNYKPTEAQLAGIKKHEAEQAIIRARVEKNWIEKFNPSGAKKKNQQ